MTAQKEDPAYYTFFLLLARACFRPGGVRALKWSNVDFAGGSSLWPTRCRSKPEIEETTLAEQVLTIVRRFSSSYWTR